MPSPHPLLSAPRVRYTTVALFCAELHDVDEGPTDLPLLLRVLCDASEFDELPVRHNEEHVNAQMARELPWLVDEKACDSPHVKAQLLLQAHFARAALPMSDYVTDTKSVLDQALRGMPTAPPTRHLWLMLALAGRGRRWLCSLVRTWPMMAVLWARVADGGCALGARGR